MKKIKFPAGIINVPFKVGFKAWRKCWNIMADNTSVFGINESLTKRQKAVYATLARFRRWGYYGLRQSPNPIFWDKREWKFVSGEVIYLHGKGPWSGRYPGYNDSRKATKVRLIHRETGTKHTFIGTHWVSAGNKVPDGWRKKVRAISIAKVGKAIKHEHKAGQIVHVLGDTNIPEPFRFDGVERFRWLRGQGIDKYGVSLPEGVRVEKSNISTRTAPTDHKHGIVVNITLLDSRK